MGLTFRSWMEEALVERRRQGLYRRRRRLQSAQGVRVRMGGREFLNFSSNDYLDLAADPRLARAAARAARRYGCGAGASPLVSGYLPPLRALERDLSRWMGTEAALVFSSGFAANVSVVSALVGSVDAIFCDKLNHASLIDGCRASQAPIHFYHHADVDHLHKLLGREEGKARRRLIVTDTVFSVDGDLAPLPEVVELAHRHGCLLLVDEAHALGVFGEHGRGVSELCSSQAALDPDCFIRTGTLSKALGAQGGFVCGSRPLIDWLVNHARPYIFSTALAPPVAAAARCAVRIVAQEPERRRHLLALAELLREQLKQIGYPIPTGWGDRATPIVPIVVGEAQVAVELSARLEEHGLLVPAFRPPSVPAGTSRLRVSLTAGHTKDDVHRLIDALRACRSQE